MLASPAPVPPVASSGPVFARGLERGQTPSASLPEPPPPSAPVPSKARGAPPPSSKGARARARLSQTAPPRSNRGAPSLPFRPPASPSIAERLPLPSLTLEQYASLRVEIDASRDAGARAAVLGRYGVTESQLEGLATAWGTRFREQPELFGRFRRAHEEYLAWLASRTPGPRSRG